jgi:hypothetical protein
MSYKIYYTDQPLAATHLPHLEALVPIECDSAETALTRAAALLAQHCDVWRIVGPDGYLLQRADVRHRCKMRERHRTSA